MKNTEYVLKRINRLRKKFLDKGIDALFVSAPVNVSYLSGFSGDDSYLFITYNDVYFITDPRYEEQIQEEIPESFNKIIFFKEREKRLIEFLGDQDIKILGIEDRRITYHMYERLKGELREKKIVPTGEIVEELRLVKDEYEISLIKSAIDVSLRAMDETIREITSGISEKEVSAKFAYLLRIYGAEKESFDTIVASGPRGALPHGVASSRIIGREDMIVLDFGVKKRGYDSDTTRTIKIGRPTSIEKEVYEIVKEAKDRAILSVKPGISTKELDKVARDYIMSKGYGRYFGHGLGHGVGMEIHEAPYISSTYDVRLCPGMVITIEPGIYLPGKFGVRIEDMVLVTDRGGEVLTKKMKTDLNYIS